MLSFTQIFSPKSTWATLDGIIGELVFLQVVQAEKPRVKN